MAVSNQEIYIDVIDNIAYQVNEDGLNTIGVVGNGLTVVAAFTEVSSTLTNVKVTLGGNGEDFNIPVSFESIVAGIYNSDNIQIDQLENNHRVTFLRINGGE